MRSPDVTSPARWQRAWLLLLLITPIALVSLAYAWLAFAHGTPWLWNVVVHEGGHYTFGQTLFFVRHFLREIPVDVAMALSLAAAIRVASPDPVPLPRHWFAWGAVLMVVVSIAVAATQEGWWEAARDLFQYRTRDDDTRYGSHWRFHLLSTIWFCSAAPLLAGVSSGARGVTRATGEGRRLMIAAWLWVLALTLVFGVGREPFTSGRYIGHQAREILTHGLITLPLVFAGGVLVGRIRPPEQAPGTHPSLQALAWVSVLGIPVFLSVAFGGTSLEDTAQLGSGLAGVVAGHVFEHVLDYVLVIAMTVAIVGQDRKAGR